MRTTDHRLSQDWIDDCMKWRGVVLTGRFAHWCFEFDGLPIDETCDKEFDCCICYDADSVFRCTPYESPLAGRPAPKV